MSDLVTRRGLAERPHGFRSGLRNRTAEVTATPHEVAGACLGHASDGNVVRACRGTDVLGQRRAVMEACARGVAGNAASLAATRAG